MVRSSTRAGGASQDQRISAYERNAAVVTERKVFPPPDDVDRPRGRFRRRPSQAAHVQADVEARREAEEVLDACDQCADRLETSLAKLAQLKRPRLLGKAEEDKKHVERAAADLSTARSALEAADFGTCGKAVSEAQRRLSAVGGQLALALNAELDQASFPRDKKEALEENLQRRKEAQRHLDHVRGSSPRAAVLAAATVYELMAEGLDLAADMLAGHRPASPRAQRSSSPDGAEVRVVAPRDLETFAQIGGLEEAKEQMRRTVGVMLERSAVGGSGMVRNGVLLYGPPGTGKTLLARAVAGEYGLRFIRLSPAVIASPYQHEPAKKLRQIFEKAAEVAPCVLFLDEVENIASRREGLTSADQRELVTQLLNSLEEYRDVPGLVIMAATNMLDDLDPALREGRFDARVAIPLPDVEAREDILAVTLEQHDLVDWDSVDLEDLAQRTAGRSGAALATIVSGAAQRALAHGGAVGQADLLAEIAGRSGQDRAQTLEHQVAWDDVVLPDHVRQRLSEILVVFQRPELGRQLGVSPPAGILLHGPPGTGKTTIARALATEGKASFYEQSAADLLSKWVGQSEQQVARLFARARANRPSIIFCDEIDAVLKRRSADSSAPWEERVVSQFLRELDGLHSGEGVLLVGATNRPDIIDDAVRERRLVPIEVPLPDASGRRKLLEVLFHDVRVGSDVDLGAVAEHTEGLSGADLKAIRNAAGMKALARTAGQGDGAEVAVTAEDVAAALSQRGLSLAMRPRTNHKKAAPRKAAPRKAAPRKAATSQAGPRKKRAAGPATKKRR